jgi:hypothetical protein
LIYLIYSDYCILAIGSRKEGFDKDAKARPARAGIAKIKKMDGYYSKKREGVSDVDPKVRTYFLPTSSLTLP